MPEIVLLSYIAITIFTVWVGLRAYGRWINHVTIYGVVWGTQIILFQLRFINYPDLSVETSAFIFGAWLVFVVAALTFRRFYAAKELNNRAIFPLDMGVTTIVLVLFTVIGALGTYQHWTVLLKMFGSVKGAIVNANLLYSFRRSEAGFPGMWPYVDSVSLAADFLGGYYAGQRRKPIVLGVLPFVVELANAIASFGRSRLIIGAILWGTAFFLPQAKSIGIDWKTTRKRVLTLLSIVLIFVFGMEFVRTFRGVNESFTGEKTSLSRLKGVGFVTPSIYLYLSSDVAVLNRFLDYEFAGDGEHTPVGGNTFAPFYRIFAKLGLTQTVLEYQKSYRVPASTNTASYLRELYADWGIGGAMFFVYLTGALTSYVYEQYQRRKSLILLALLAHLNVVVFFSFAVQATRWGYWVISLAVSIVGALAIEKYSKSVKVS